MQMQLLLNEYASMVAVYLSNILDTSFPMMFAFCKCILKTKGLGKMVFPL